MRPGEQDGVDYHFVDVDMFWQMYRRRRISRMGACLRPVATVPTRHRVEELFATGKDVLFDIDWQGAQQLYQEAGPDVVRVFILPPTMEELAGTLAARAQHRQRRGDRGADGTRGERDQPLGRL